MKKLLLVTTALILFTVTNAQVWCPPGATWNYRLKTGIGQGQNNYNGYLDVSVTGTTVIAGKTCTTISGAWSGTWNWPTSMPMNWGQSIDTYFQNNIVYYYETKSGKFDTVMDYNAVPGASWYVSGWDSSCIPFSIPQPYKYIVTDTGHISVSGISLKTFTISQSAFPQWKYQLIERIGNTSLFFHDIYSCVLDGGDKRGNFSCYRDNQLGIYSKNNECNFVSLNEESKDSHGFQVFPNPSVGFYHLSISKSSIVEIYNMAGALVYRNRHEAGDTEIDISAFSDGLYLVKLDNGQAQKICKGNYH